MPDTPDLSALWPLLPPWIEWVAMNSQKHWVAFTKRPRVPEQNPFSWDAWENGEGEMSFYIPRKYAPRWSGDWRKSLTRRPKNAGSEAR